MIRPLIQLSCHLSVFVAFMSAAVEINASSTADSVDYFFHHEKPQKKQLRKKFSHFEDALSVVYYAQKSTSDSKVLFGFPADKIGHQKTILPEVKPQLHLKAIHYLPSTSSYTKDALPLAGQYRVEKKVIKHQIEGPIRRTEKVPHRYISAKIKPAKRRRYWPKRQQITKGVYRSKLLIDNIVFLRPKPTYRQVFSMQKLKDQKNLDKASTVVEKLDFKQKLSNIKLKKPHILLSELFLSTSWRSHNYTLGYENSSKPIHGFFSADNIHISKKRSAQLLMPLIAIAPTNLANHIKAFTYAKEKLPRIVSIDLLYSSAVIEKAHMPLAEEDKMVQIFFPSYDTEVNGPAKEQIFFKMHNYNMDFVVLNQGIKKHDTEHVLWSFEELLYDNDYMPWCVHYSKHLPGHYGSLKAQLSMIEKAPCTKKMIRSYPFKSFVRNNFNENYAMAKQATAFDLEHALYKTQLALRTTSNRKASFAKALYEHEHRFDPILAARQTLLTTPKLPSCLKTLRKALEGSLGLRHLASIPSLSELNTNVLSTEFKTEAEVISDPSGSGYYFTLKISPFHKEQLHRMRQNIYFVIDHSRSLSKEKFQTFKKSILRALPYVHRDDNFNIIIADKSVEVLSRHNLAPTEKAQKKAKSFLSNISYATHSSPKTFEDILQFIEQSYARDDAEMHTVVLMTDGSAYKAKHALQDKVKSLIKSNRKKMKIYTVAVSAQNATYALDAISFANRASSLHAKTFASMPRKLAILVRKISNPIAAKPSITLVRAEDSSTVFFTDDAFTHDMYADQPFTIYGKTQTLSELEFMIQGRLEDEWVNITQKYDLRDAQKADRIILRDCRHIEDHIQSLSDLKTAP